MDIPKLLHLLRHHYRYTGIAFVIIMVLIAGIVAQSTRPAALTAANYQSKTAQPIKSVNQVTNGAAAPTTNAATANKSASTTSQTAQVSQSATINPGGVAPTSTSTASSTTTVTSLTLSPASITLHKISAADSGKAQLTITSTAGPITQPIGSAYQKSVALENSGTPPSSTIFRKQWTYTIERIDNSYYGSDIIVFTATTATGQTITTRLAVTIEPIPSFTVTKGALTKVTNGDGTVTYTANYTVNPSAYFGTPQLHMCILDSQNYCAETQDFTYSGANNLSMSRTITPFPSGDIHAYFDISVLIDGLYTNGGATMSWHVDY